MAGISARPSWAPHDLLLAFDEDGVTAITEGRYRAWDALNRRYGVSQIDTHRLEKRGAVALTFVARYNMPLIAEEYAKLPNTLYADTQWWVAMGTTYVFSIHRTKHLYVFDAGTGDCPAGCIDHTYWGFAVDVKGKVTVLARGQESTWRDRAAWLRSSAPAGDGCSVTLMVRRQMSLSCWFAIDSPVLRGQDAQNPNLVIGR